MTRIRTQQELKALYPDHFRVLLGYWMSGSTATEQLDRIVERLEQRAQDNPPVVQAGATQGAARQTGTQGQASSTGTKPQTQSQQPLTQNQKQPLPPGRQAYAQRVWENRKKAGLATAHYDTAIRKQTPMVFRRYGGQDIACTISKDGGDTFTLLVDGRRQVVWKTRLLYSYKTRSQQAVEKAITIDEQVKAQNLQPILPQAKRYQIPDEDLLSCKREGSKLRLVMRGGEVVVGRIEWFGAFDIKVELTGRRSVVVFRHAILSHLVIRKE